MSVTRQVQQDRLNTSRICTTLSPASGLETLDITYHISTSPTSPVVGYHTYDSHHTDTCHLQESNFGMKVLEDPSLRVRELLLLLDSRGTVASGPDATVVCTDSSCTVDMTVETRAGALGLV